MMMMTICVDAELLVVWSRSKIYFAPTTLTELNWQLLAGFCFKILNFFSHKLVHGKYFCKNSYK